MSKISRNYYSTPSESQIAEVNVNLVKGHPEDHTIKLYKNLNLMVEPSCRVSINGNEIFIHKALGLSISSETHEPVTDFRILDPNVSIYYLASW